MELVRYDAMCRAVAECEAIDEVKDLSDRAAALAAYARQADDPELHARIQRIRLRAERRLGELSKTIPRLDKAADFRREEERLKAERAKVITGDHLDARAKVITGDHLDAPVHVRNYLEELARANVSRGRALRAEQIAAIPDEEFEALVAAQTPPSIKRLVAQGRAERDKPPAKEKPAVPLRTYHDAMWAHAPRICGGCGDAIKHPLWARTAGSLKVGLYLLCLGCERLAKGQGLAHLVEQLRTHEVPHKPSLARTAREQARTVQTQVTGEETPEDQRSMW